METREEAMTPSAVEVLMVEPELVRQMRGLSAQGWGSKRIARELEVSRCLRGDPAAEVQERPGARRLDQALRARAAELFDTTADGNAVVVAELLAEDGVTASVRTVQRVLAEQGGIGGQVRQAKRPGSA